MIYHFVGAYVKDTPPTTLVTSQIAHRDDPVIHLLPPNTYAYFIFDSYTITEILPVNISPVTFFGGRVFTKDELEIESLARGKSLKVSVIALPGMSMEKVMSAKALIRTAEGIWMPFFEKDILINIKSDLK